MAALNTSQARRVFVLDLAVNAAGLDKADSQPMLGVLEADEHVVATTKRHAKRSVILATTGRLRPKKPATSYWMQRLRAA